ncbi:MAG: hypothetical protein KGI60_01585 [Patescibacteria group bacterium]|nr:hypothetical protein [Patescibacteria group bacterium]
MNAHIRVIESDITAKKESATIMSFTEKLVIMVPFANPDIRRPDQAKEFELPVLVQGTIDTAESTGVLDITFITRKINRRMPMRVSCHIGTRGQICTTSSVEEEYFRGLPIIGNFHQPDPFEMK